MDNIINDLTNMVAKDAKQQYNIYKEKIKILESQYKDLKKENLIISKLIQKLRNENIIDLHLSKLFALVQGNGYKRARNNEKDLQIITKYFEKVQNLSVEGLKLIFEIRKFFTGQEFDIFIENEGKIFSFSIDDIEKHIGGIIPTYTDSLEKFINNMIKDSRAIAPELNKLGLTLKTSEKDTQLYGIQEYLNFVNNHVKKNKIAISDNRKLEAAIYLYGRNENADFNNESIKQSMRIMLGWYISKGGTKDNITMYKLGDALQKTELGFRNIEIKMHNGTISLTMVANGIKKLNTAFHSTDEKDKIIKFFTANKTQLSSPIEKEADKIVRDKIEEVFKEIDKN